MVASYTEGLQDGIDTALKVLATYSDDEPIKFDEYMCRILQDKILNQFKKGYVPATIMTPERKYKE